MCLGVPMRVVRQQGAAALCCDDDGGRHWIDTLLVGEQPAGAWLLTHLGAAREVIDEARARAVASALSAVESLMAGESPDLHAAFGDLLGREPQLPDFLGKE